MRLVKETLDPKRRIIMISDIHGEKDLLIKLLTKVDFNKEDYLFLLGDYVGKGYNSLETLHYIMELSKQDNVYLIAGNCDLLFNSLYNEEESIHKNEVPNLYDLFQHYHSLMEEMLDVLNIKITKDLDFKKVAPIIYENFKEELEFVRNLPRVIETEEFIFVHSAIKDDDYSLDTDFELMRTSEFVNKTNKRFKKYVVVGHYPTLNYCNKIPSLNSMINYRKNIICLDGGMNVIPYGQLNALVYEKNVFTNYYVDKLDLYEIKKDNFPLNPNPLTINFENNEVEIIEEQDEFYKCFHPQSQIFIDIDKDYIYKRDNHIYTNDTTNYELETNRGDIVHLIKKYKDKSFVKKSGIVGFIPNSCLGNKL